MALRAFLYLDRPLVRDFSAQTEHGVVDEATERQTNTGKGGVGGRLGHGLLSISADKSKERSMESAAIVRQNAPSEFDRLYTYLESDDLVVIEEMNESSAVSEIRRKQFIEVDARVRVSGLHQLLQLFGTFGALAPMMEQLGTDTKIDQETMTMMQAISSLPFMEGRVSRSVLNSIWFIRWWIGGMLTLRCC